RYIITEKKEYLQPYALALPAIEIVKKELIETTKNDPLYKQKVEGLWPVLKLKLDGMATRVALVEEGKKKEAEEEVAKGNGRANMESIRTIFKDMEKEANDQLEADEKKVEAAAHTTMRTVLAAIPLSLLIVSVASYFIVRSITVPIG